MKNPAKAGFFLIAYEQQILLKPLCKRASALASVPELVRPDNFLSVSAGFPRETC
jgi:polar amino acid transport system substrate-binding protein